MDAEALRAIADGVRLNLDTVPDAEASAVALQDKLQELDKATNAAPAEVAERVRCAHRQAASCASAAAITATSRAA